MRQGAPNLIWKQQHTDSSRDSATEDEDADSSRDCLDRVRDPRSSTSLDREEREREREKAEKTQ